MVEYTQENSTETAVEATAAMAAETSSQERLGDAFLNYHELGGFYIAE